MLRVPRTSIFIYFAKVAHSPSDVESHEFEPLSPSGTEIAPGSYSEEEVVEMDATFDTSPGMLEILGSDHCG